MFKMGILKQGDKYLHFKGYKYEIVLTARDADNPNKFRVIYKSLIENEGFPIGTYWDRGLEDFVGEKVFEKNCEYNGIEYKKGDKVKRFTKINK